MSQHELKQLTKDQRSLLLYFETCAVDQGGLVDVRRMNAEDLALAAAWCRSGFVRFGRVRAADAARMTGAYQGTHWCELSETAWRLAHAERRARQGRLSQKRTWRKIGGNRDGQVQH